MAYATLAELRSYLNIATADTGDDALLTQLLGDAQGLIDAWAGWSFEASPAETRYFNPLVDVDKNDRLLLHLDAPLLTCTKVTNGDSTEVTPAQYYLMPTNSMPKWGIRLRGSTGLSWTYEDDPEQAVSVLGTWGFSAVADDVIRRACIRWAAYLYRQRDAQVFDVTAQPAEGVLTIPQGMPRDVERMLASYRRTC